MSDFEFAKAIEAASNRFGLGSVANVCDVSIPTVVRWIAMKNQPWRLFRRFYLRKIQLLSENRG